MGLTHSFRFKDDKLERQLIELLKKTAINHFVDERGVVHYSPDDEERVDALLCSVRDHVFTSWQVLTCPKNWIDRYRDYMKQHDVPFKEELADNQLWFLIPRKYRPHSWKLDNQSLMNKKRHRPLR